MKKYILIILPVFLLLSCFGLDPRQSSDRLSPSGFTSFNMSLNQHKEGTYFLLVKDERTISINTYENGSINEIRTIDVPENSIVGTNQKDVIAVIDTNNNTILIYDINTSKETQLSIPFSIKPKCILINNENIFIGGIMGEELLIQYHLKNEEWHRLEIPQEVTIWGKAIDDMVINDNFLIAVDNIVIPKYILFYHLNPTSKLEYSHYRELKDNGPYEHIYQARISPKYLGLASYTISGYTGVFQHITIYNDLELRHSFAISFRIERISDLYSNRRINDFIIIQDKIYIADRINGLGILEIDESYFRANRRNFEIDAKNINYMQYTNEEILRFTQVPNEDKIILTIRSLTGAIRYAIFEL
ncbi:MAG: hypothetical protein FWD28_06965 [Treponema sp.]|nr:hypothetical protein [Treponema sp.]